MSYWRSLLADDTPAAIFSLQQGVAGRSVDSGVCEPSVGGASASIHRLRLVSSGSRIHAERPPELGQ